MIVLLILIGVAILLALFTVGLYNRMVSRRNAVDNSYGQIEAALQRRHDLIPNLVESVKGYAKHERETFENVTKARAGAMAAKGPAEQAAAEGMLNQAMGRLNAVIEQYPDLRATENFQQLQAELSNTENQIAITRRVYNDTVQTYNTGIQVFPAVIIANAFNFERREFFDAPDEVETVPTVDFGTGGGDAAAGEAAKPTAS